MEDLSFFEGGENFGPVPAPGETFMQWWEDTGYAEAKREQEEREGRSPDEEEDVYQMYYSDLPRELADADLALGEGRENAPSEPWPLTVWPGVPTRVLLCRTDRMPNKAGT